MANPYGPRPKKKGPWERMFEQAPDRASDLTKYANYRDAIHLYCQKNNIPVEIEIKAGHLLVKLRKEKVKPIDAYEKAMEVVRGK